MEPRRTAAEADLPRLQRKLWRTRAYERDGYAHTPTTAAAQRTAAAVAAASTAMRANNIRKEAGWAYSITAGRGCYGEAEW